MADTLTSRIINAHFNVMTLGTTENPQTIGFVQKVRKERRMTRHDEAMQMLDQLETLLKRTEDTPERMPTNRALLIVARVVYWLLERWAKEHGK